MRRVNTYTVKNKDYLRALLMGLQVLKVRHTTTTMKTRKLLSVFTTRTQQEKLQQMQHIPFAVLEGSNIVFDSYL